MKITTLLLALLLSILSANGRTSLIVIYGQSNAKGYSINELTYSEKLLSSHIHIWDGAFEPYQFGVNDNSSAGRHGVDACLSALNSYLLPEDTIYMVKVGIGNEPITTFLDGGTGYSMLEARINTLTLSDYDDVVMLYLQGESDAANGSTIFGSQLMLLLSQQRDLFGVPMKFIVPNIRVTSGYYESESIVVNNSIDSVAAIDSDVYTFVTKDFEYNPSEKFHYSTIGMRRMAYKLLSIFRDIRN